MTVQILREYFVRTISSEPLNLSSWNLVWLCIIMIRSVMQKGWVLSSTSRSQCRVKSSKNNSFHISWTSNSFATRFGILIHHHMSEFRLLSWRSRSHWGFKFSRNIWRDIFWTTQHFWMKLMVCWCIIMTWSVIQKVWVPILKVNVTMRAEILKT